MELVPGYGVFLTQRQIDATLTAADNGTKLMRNLLSCFFPPETLAVSSAYGTRTGKQALHPEILGACIRKCGSFLTYS